MKCRGFGPGCMGMVTKMKTGFIPLVLLAAVLILSGCVVSSASEPQAIGTRELLEAYKQDPTKAKPVYDGENIRVTGVVVYVGPDIHNLPSIELSDAANEPGQVLCVFDSLDLTKGVSSGDTVTISGNFHIVSSGGMVVLKQSRIQ